MQRVSRWTRPLVGAALALFAVIVAACADASLPTAPRPGALRANAAPLGVSQLVTSAVDSALCVDIAGASKLDGARATIYPCHRGDNQQLRFEANGQLRVYGYMCLDVNLTGGPQGSDGDYVQLWTCYAGAANQRWELTPEGTIKNGAGRCLDLPSGDTTPGAQLTVWTCHGYTNQRWRVRDVEALDYGDVAELPRAYVDTRMPVAAGRRLDVSVGPTPDSSGTLLQAALDTARAGDQVVIPAGATFVGNFVLPVKDLTEDQWIIVRTSGTLPAEGTRVGPADAAQMPKLLSKNFDPVLTAPPAPPGRRAGGWRLVGLELAFTENPRLADGTEVYNLVSFGSGNSDQSTLESVPRRLVIDRSYLHGQDNLSMRRCLGLNSAASAVIDSYFAKCHGVNESQAIFGQNGPGPFKIVNNYLEGAFEVIFFGGQTPKIAGLIPSDVEIRRNHITRPMAWRGRWTAKNLFELKAGQRMLLEGNVMENNWQQGQSGYGILLQALSDENDAPYLRVSDITLRYNKILNTFQGITLASRVAYEGGPMPTERMQRVTIVGNLIEVNDALKVSGTPPKPFTLNGDLANVTIARNTVVGIGGQTMGMFMYLTDEANLGLQSGLRVLNNVFGHAEYTILGEGTSRPDSTFTRFAPDALGPGRTSGNVFVGPSGVGFPPGNYHRTDATAAGMLNVGSRDYRLVPPLPYLPAGAPVPGADFAALERATAGVVR